MADWCGSARTNYFRVNNRDMFTQWAESLGDLEVVEDAEGRVALLSLAEFGGWPKWRNNKRTGHAEAIDILVEVVEHLEEGSVAIFLEVGAEKLRYLTGRACAVNAKGNTVTVDIDDIYERAKSLGKDITIGEY